MRSHRIEYAGAVYHVMQRSSNQEKLFGHQSNKKELLQLHSDQKQKLDYKLSGYVIMDTHFLPNTAYQIITTGISRS